MTASSRLPVVIVGAGPVGLTLAACLARLGVASAVLEARIGPGAGSRAICLSRRTLEVFDWAGCGAAVADASLGWRTGRTYFGDKEVHRLQMDQDADQRRLPMYNLQQYRLEALLEAHCRATGLVDIRAGAEVAGAEQGQGLVRLSLADDTKLTADWAVACDGARSAMRKALGLRLEGRSYDGRYLIADIHMPSASPTERRFWFSPASNPDSTVIMHRQPDDIWRIDYQLVDGESDAEALRPARLRERIAAHLDLIGETAPWRLVWSSIYRAHTRALASYRHGRVLFAGDAAHLVPIFGVRGLNSGIADAHNLAWKLARVLAGTSPDVLLDSYAQERRAATLEIFRQSARTTRFVSPASAGDRVMRDAVLSLAVEHGFVRPLIDPRQSQPNDYAGSPLNTPDRAGEVFETGPAPGSVIRELRLGDGWLLDRLGHGFACVCGDSGAAEALRRARVEIVTAPPNPWLDGAATYLVRPDGHVAARWRRPSPGLVGAAIARASGA